MLMSLFRTGTLAATALVLTAFLSAGNLGAQRIPDIPERARGAERVVVGSVRDVNATREQTEWGDEIIVSHATLAVEESLKGDPQPAVVLDVEGGTVDGVTMHVSSLPTIDRGERGVFFLTRGNSGHYRPYLRGLGILKLDASNTVKGSSLTLADIRRMARATAQ